MKKLDSLMELAMYVFGIRATVMCRRPLRNLIPLLIPRTLGNSPGP